MEETVSTVPDSISATRAATFDVFVFAWNLTVGCLSIVAGCGSYAINFISRRMHKIYHAIGIALE